MNQSFFFFLPLNFNSSHRRHSLRDQPGPELPTSDHRPVGAGGRVAVPSARWVSDSQLPRGPAALLPHRPSYLMPPQREPAEAQSRFKSGQESLSLPFRKEVRKKNCLCRWSNVLNEWTRGHMTRISYTRTSVGRPPTKSPCVLTKWSSAGRKTRS